MPFEKYKSSKEEIKNAEEMMTDNEKSATEKRILELKEKRSGIPDVMPLYEGSLLEVRRDQAEAVKENLDKNDQLVLGIAPRTGSTSTMELLGSMYKQEGVGVILSSSHRRPDEIRRKILDLRIERDKGPNKDKEIIVIIDEANGLLALQGNVEKGDSDAEDKDILDGFYKIFEKGKKDKVKFVFLSHDFYGEDGEGGVNAMKKFLQKSPGGAEAKTADMQLETLDKQGLGKVFDILAKEKLLPPDLIERREEILSLSTTPQQISLIVKEYLKAINNGEDDAEAWKKAIILENTIENSMSDLVRICGGEHMKKLLERVAEKGTLSLTDLDEKERKLYDRYKKFHIFEEEGDGIRINGKMLEGLVKEGRL